MATTVPRVVVVTRRTEYELLLNHHATRGQAAFFLEQRGQGLEDLERLDQKQRDCVHGLIRSIPTNWRRHRVDRDDLDRFLFEPDDIVVALGQDGLVANLAKYVSGQPVIGLNPAPELYEGVLARHGIEQAGRLIRGAVEGGPCEARTMVKAELDDGQSLLALNEIFIGHQSHQSARYRIRFGEEEEAHSSSGMVVTSGTGATGWARSIHAAYRSRRTLPEPTSGKLAFFVREPFPSPSTGTSIKEGPIDRDTPLYLVSEMNRGGVVFGDGIETDRLDFSWGRTLQVQPAMEKLRLVV